MDYIKESKSNPNVQGLSEFAQCNVAIFAASAKYNLNFYSLFLDASEFLYRNERKRCKGGYLIQDGCWVVQTRWIIREGLPDFRSLLRYPCPCSVKFQGVRVYSTKPVYLVRLTFPEKPRFNFVLYTAARIKMSSV